MIGYKPTINLPLYLASIMVSIWSNQLKASDLANIKIQLVTELLDMVIALNLVRVLLAFLKHRQLNCYLVMFPRLNNVSDPISEFH
jgi:undecaprenyl pyrophosphate phosphatase UppP